MDFVHLHVHSEYSLLDGACRIEGLIQRVKELGQTSVAITDHGVMYGAIDFYKAAKKEGIKPIIGCEVYMAARTRFDRVHELDAENAHLILLAKNNEGYQNLIALVSEAWIDGFYGKPRVDFELLEKYSNGLIAMSACIAGIIPQAILRGDYNDAKEKALRFSRIFGQGNFYLELQDHNLKEQKMVNPELIKLSKETGIPLVATNDAHYNKREHSEMQKILMCIQMNKTIDEPNPIGFATEEFYIKSIEEMQSLFKEVPEAIENTVKIAEMCNVDFEFGNIKLPHFEVEGGKDHFIHFKELCEKGLAEKYGENPNQIVLDRLNYELNTINRMGYVDYFLIVYDFIRYAKEVGIPVGPGRGSGAASLAAYCIGITGIDPIRYNLLFERFLNPERISMPDFDIDFCYERRQEVIDYVVRKYGSDHVAQIITFGTMAAKGAIRDVGRALNMPYSDVDIVAKLIPFGIHMSLDSAMQNTPELKALYENDVKVKRLIDYAKQLEGMPRHASTHAAGVVITRDPVNHYVPLSKNDQAIVTQYTMGTLEELGLLKMDFLGLRNLTVIKYSVDMIKNHTPEFDINKISLEDKNICKMLADGHTLGVFQFESAGMRQVLSQLKPEGIEDLIAVIALYRPGPMESIPKYIKNRHHPELVTYHHPLLKDILDVTYGCIVYQEQVMQIVRKLAGYSMGRADLVRRAMSKKKAKVMEEERHNFIYGKKNADGSSECIGALANGVDEKTADAIFDEMASFASYAFNKAHAAAYAMLAYQTAYLKYYYPKEYMAALLTSVLDNTDKLIEYINECNRIEIKVLPPDVNISIDGFTVSGNDIRFGLLAVKNLGRGFINELVKERERGGIFTSFNEFCNRMSSRDFNKRTMEGLIKCGACDCFGYNRRQLLIGYVAILDNIDSQKRRNLEGQMNLFGESEEANRIDEQMPKVDEFTRKELLNYEKDTTGLYLSGHPMAEYAKVADKLNAATTHKIIYSINENDGIYKDGDMINIIGIVASRKLKATKSDTTMAFLLIEDTYGSMEVLVFPKILEKYGAIIKQDAVLLIRGKISVREDEDPKILAEDIALPPSPGPAEKTKANRNGLYIKVSSQNCEEFLNAKKVAEIFSGSTPLYVFFIDTNKLTAAPQTLWVSINNTLISELKDILGEENVAVKG